MAAPVKTYPQKLINIPVKDKNSWSNSQVLQKKIKEIESELGDDGRVVIRPSGTENLLRVMVEAPTDDAVNKYTDQLANVVQQELN